MIHQRREPAPGVFRLVLPLPFPGLHAVNAFLLADDDETTLVDCGIFDPDAERDHGWDDLVEALQVCDSGIDKIKRLVITHPHIDHYGMAARLLEETGCELWMHSAATEQLEVYRDPSAHRERLRDMLGDHGITNEEIDELTSFEDWRGFISGVVEATHLVEGGEKFTAGPRTWEVVYTPGHSHAHVCFWSESDGLFLSGDHLLPTITPHIDFVRGETDPLGDFLRSLAIVEKLDPKLVLPGHGHPFEDGAERARVVERHHDRRLGAILQVIRHEPKTTNEIVDEIFGSELLNFDRRLALGEALAHLVHLRRNGEIERIEKDGIFLYKKVRREHSHDDDEDA